MNRIIVRNNYEGKKYFRKGTTKECLHKVKLATLVHGKEEEDEEERLDFFLTAIYSTRVQLQN
jgi:hypothetical protein